MSPKRWLPEASRPSGALAHQILPRALGHDDHGVAAPRQPVLQQPQEAVERERELGHETHVHLAAGQRGIGRDEAGVAAHQLHETDAVARAERLDVRRVERAPRFGHRRLEAERSHDVRDVVVDRLRDADDRDRRPRRADFLGDRLRARAACRRRRR